MPNSQDPHITPDSVERMDCHAGDWVQHHVGQPVTVHSHGMETGTCVQQQNLPYKVWKRFG